MTSVAIYALFDHREPEVVRYVGKTIKPLKERLWKHLEDITNAAVRSHKKNWLIGLSREGARPSIRLLEALTEYQDWQERERFWIAKFSGPHLTNGNSGGLGGHVPTAAARQKLREANLGKRASMEARMNMRLAHLGKPLSLACRAKLSAVRKGRKLTLEHARNIGLGHKGKTISTKHRIQISIAKTGTRWSDEQRARHSTTIREMWRKKKEAENYVNFN